jgi:tetratricopeptide (TPR) repeat protein
VHVAAAPSRPSVDEHPLFEVSRRSLHRVLDRAVARPLVTLTAAHGYGKSSALSSWARTRRSGWLRATALHRDPSVFGAGLVTALRGAAGSGAWPEGLGPPAIVEQVARSVDAPAVVVIDEADEIVASPAVEVIRALGSLPGGRIRLVIGSRVDLGLVDARLRGRGRALELDASDLNFDRDDIAHALGAAVCARWPNAVDEVEAATGGWPAGVDTAGRHLRASLGAPRPTDPTALTMSDSPVVTVARSVLLADEDPAARRLLAAVALLGVADHARLATLRQEPATVTAARLTDLVRRGLARTSPTRGGAHGSHQHHRAHDVELTPVVQRAVLDEMSDTGDERGTRTDPEPAVAAPQRVATEVAERLLDAGDPQGALRVLMAGGARSRIPAVLEAHGDELRRSGHHDLVAAAAEAVPDQARGAALDRIHGDALQRSGAWDAALERFLTLAEGDGPLSVEVALRIGRLHHLRGDLRAALEVFERARPDVGSDAAAIELWSWWATTHWLRGEPEAARQQLALAEEGAGRTGAPRSLAFVHTVRSLLAISEGDPAGYERAHRTAFAAADRAGDREQLARLRVNRGSQHLARGRVTEALFEIERALALTADTPAGTLEAIARCNRAEVLLRTGRIDEAEMDALTARTALEELGARTASYALHLLGDVARERGELDRATGRYRRSLEVAGDDADHQAMLPATIGLIRTLAVTDPGGAEELAGSLLGMPGASGSAGAWLAGAWAALAVEDRDTAAERVSEAGRVAVRRADLRGDAEAATVAALLDHDPVPGLRDAARRWHRLHDPVWATRTELGLARRSLVSDERSRAGDLEVRLARLGCAVRGGEIGHRLLCVGAAVPVRIRALGGLTIERAGVPLEGWGSAVDRRVLAALVVHAGHGISREELAHLVWPERPFTDVEERLDEAVVAVGTTLAAPGVGNGLDIAARSLQLRVDRLELDLYEFERAAELGLRAVRAGRSREAFIWLRAAQDLHRGDLLAGGPVIAAVSARRALVERRRDAVERALRRLQPELADLEAASTS